MYFEGEPYNDADRLFSGAEPKELLIVKLMPPPPGLEPDSKLAMFDIVLFRG